MMLVEHQEVMFTLYVKSMYRSSHILLLLLHITWCPKLPLKPVHPLET